MFPVRLRPLFCDHSRPAEIAIPVKKEVQTGEKLQLVQLVPKSLRKRKSSLEGSTNLLVVVRSIH